VDNDGISPLAGAALWGNEAAVKLLLDRGARINPPKNVGRSALHEAARKQYTTVRLLLDRGANINVVNNHGWTPLHNAAKEGRPRTAKLLLDRGASPDLKNKAGLTALDLATKNNHDKVVEVLLQHKKAAGPRKLPQPKERWERLEKSPVRIVYREPKQKR
jgi:ankyrin repeat protein